VEDEGPTVTGEQALSRVAGRPRVAAAATRETLVVQAFEAHQRELMSFAYAVTRDRNVAEDLVQETFLRLVREYAAGFEPDNTRAWLYRVCSNLAISRARRRSVVDRLIRFGSSSGSEPPADVDAMRHELSHEISRALTIVSPDARAALVMAAHGFSGREIARSIGRSEVATRTLMFRARERLRVHLTAEGLAP
jgi:RNA polymerase sigma-70 factor (ECF subfamily)